MKVNNVRSLLVAGGFTVLSAVSLTMMSGCSNGYEGPSRVYRPVYYDPWDYYYYPSVRVYFHISSGFYHYHDGRSWIRVRTLPPRYRLDGRDRVRLIIKTDRPYIHHEKHRVRYVPKKVYRHDKKKNKLERSRNMERHKHFHKRRR